MSTSSSSSSDSIVVVGCGLCGCMISLLLAQRGEHVILLEQRQDIRTLVSAPPSPTAHTAEATSSPTGRLTNSLKRSINLALSHRGVSALKASGVFHRVSNHLIPMRGRYIHPIGNETPSFQPYGVGDQAIYSVSRGGLNRLLMDELQKLPNVEMRFDVKVEGVDADGVVTFSEVKDHKVPIRLRIPSRVVIGADGAFSRVRGSLGKLIRLNLSTHFIPHGYKELTIPPLKGDFAFKDWQGLHIWPRDEFMLIALPNPDKSFTCTLFAPFQGEYGLDSLTTDEAVLKYFRKYFPDVIPLMPDMLNDFKASPSSALVSVRATPWHYKDKVVILGDAAHAVVPFYGQGMNAGFEDCLIMAELYDKYKGDWKDIVPQFTETRNEAGLALADLSLENYLEMRHEVASTMFVLKKRVESVLHYVFPSWWIPKYTMVAFTRIPYHIASKRAKKQEKMLNGALTVFGLAAATAAFWGVKQWMGATSTSSSQLFQWDKIVKSLKGDSSSSGSPNAQSKL